MSKTLVKFDNTLKKTEIEIPIINEDSEYVYNSHRSNIDQTKVYGIVSPLIQINSIMIDFSAIISFNLQTTGLLPTLTMRVTDNNRLITNIDKPGVDNEVRVQILPAFDGVYKKIDLVFYVSKISINDNIVNLQCTYKLPDLVKTRLESFGYVSTYDLCEKIARGTQLGFATNIENNYDNRYIYCNNKSYLDTLENELNYSDSHFQILDCWVDFFDNLNLVDIKERFETVDIDDDMKIWISSQRFDVNSDIENFNENEPSLMPAIITNHPGFNSNELYVKEHVHKLNSGFNMASGSDAIYTTYNDIKNEHDDYLFQNGDVQKDIFTKYEYLGEVYGNYNYLLAKPLRESFIRKMMSETVTVTLPSPVFGLIRGGKVNFIRYVNDDIIEYKISSIEDIDVKIKNENGSVEEIKLIDRNISSNIPLDDYEFKNSEDASGTYKLDRNISGQYLIMGVEIKYCGFGSNKGWEYKLNMVKPVSKSIIALDKV